MQRDAKELHESACEHFGTWDTALRYAGVSRHRASAKHYYTRERVVQEVRKLCVAGYNLMAARRMRPHRRLYRAARQHFGG